MQKAERISDFKKEKKERLLSSDLKQSIKKNLEDYLKTENPELPFIDTLIPKLEAKYKKSVFKNKLGFILEFNIVLCIAFFFLSFDKIIVNNIENNLFVRQIFFFLPTTMLQ